MLGAWGLSQYPYIIPPQVTISNAANEPSVIMTLLIAAVQQMTVSQLRTSEDERNYERALQMAESGLVDHLLANADPMRLQDHFAYLHRL